MTSYTVLQESVNQGDTSAFTLLLGDQNIEQAMIDKLLVLASSKNQPEMVKALLERNADPFLWNGRALTVALEGNYEAIADLLYPTGCLDSTWEDLEMRKTDGECEVQWSEIESRIFDMEQRAEKNNDAGGKKSHRM